MKPVYIDQQLCGTCRSEAVGVTTGWVRLLWCIEGHITLDDFTVEKHHMLADVKEVLYKI